MYRLRLERRLGSVFWRARTCEVQASERNEVLDIVISQFHHDQADQKPAT